MALSEIVESVTQAAAEAHEQTPEHVTCTFVIDGCRTSLPFGSDIHTSITDKYVVPEKCDCMTDIV